MNNKLFIASSLGLDPHTEGMHQAGKVAALVGVESIVLPPSDNFDHLFRSIVDRNPSYIGLSYRLSPKTGVSLLEKVIHQMYHHGVVHADDEVKICFSGLPETIEMARAIVPSLPLKVRLIEELADPLERAIDTLSFFGGGGSETDKIVEKLREELKPEGISLLDELADEVVRNDDYKCEPALRIPSDSAKNDFTIRMSESDFPLLRTHFGIPDNTVIPTVEGIRKLADACVVDEISLGSSDLSQRYFGHPEKFDELKNDGGVPYRDKKDLALLFEATRRGNFPSLKPYCHVSDLVPFVKSCLNLGLLRGGHQAVPLFWFNELDGRGPMTVRESLHEHFACVRELAKNGIPVEMNDPNQWASRLAHDTIITSSYALICSVMKACGVKDMIFQMQLNKPKEVGDYADLAKMEAARDIINQISSPYQRSFIETRTGIESFSTDMERAKWQLGRSTLLQMLLNPSVIHIVSYCEANYAARPDDIIDSSRLIRKAVKIFRENEPDIRNAVKRDIVEARKHYLISETQIMLDSIAKLNPNYQKNLNFDELSRLVAAPDILATAVERKIFTAPGVANPKYKGDFITKVMKYGMINLVDNYTAPQIISEAERMKSL